MNKADLREHICTFSAMSDQLWWEANPNCQEGLRKLLIKEEDRVGARVEHLEVVERNLVKGAELIARQRRSISEATMKSELRETAERSLHALEGIQAIFQELRALILHALERCGER